MIIARYSRDGGINSSELKGDMILTVNSEPAAFVRVNLAPIRDKSLQLKNHPNINKQVQQAHIHGHRAHFFHLLRPFERVAPQVLSSDNALCHKDSSKSFPLGTPLPILKWKSAASADHFVPIKVVRASATMLFAGLLPQMNNLTPCNSRAGPALAPTPPL